MDILRSPMTLKQIISMSENDENGYIHGTMPFSLSEIMDNDFEGMMDLFSERLTATDLLMDIHYEAVGFADGMILIKVTGDPETIIDGEFGLKDEFPYNLQPGDEVAWNDPDDGLCSVTGIISEIEWNGDSATIMFTSGQEIEVLAGELS
jgi:hypothetical protein